MLVIVVPQKKLAVGSWQLAVLPPTANCQLPTTNFFISFRASPCDMAAPQKRSGKRLSAALCPLQPWRKAPANGDAPESAGCVFSVCILLTTACRATGMPEACRA
jgi:hypothetical protein